MKRSNIIDLSEQFKTFRENKVKWTVLGKKFYSFDVYLRCQAFKVKMRVYKDPGTQLMCIPQEMK